MLSSKTKDAAAEKTLNDPHWQQVPTMDTQADGQFIIHSKSQMCIGSCRVVLAKVIE